MRRTLACILLLASAAARAGDGSCTRVSETCTQGAETRVINGQSIYRPCWQYQDEFNCTAATPVDACAPLVARGCQQVNSTCASRLSTGACALWTQTYACQVGTGPATTVTDCGSQSFCLSGNCFDTGHPPDGDFARTVSVLEAQREAGQYLDPDTLQVFTGRDNRCRDKLFGLANCCKGGGADGSLLSTASLVAGAGGQALGVVGSTYTFDALYANDAPDWVLSGFNLLFGAGGGNSALAGLLAGDVSVSSFLQTLVPGPWTVALFAVEYSGILSCEQSEQTLAMKNDTRLCHAVGSYCSVQVPVIDVCLETTQSYCCFNSRLARLINEQGRAQVGRGWGTAQAPDCSGFTLAQLQGLDFSRMNLSEFYAEIAPTLPTVPALQQQARQKINAAPTR